ncbi:MAG TPA: tetratricopeptide repeat protein [Woeseiaceae bacterium]|jgi:tetratricopeptide (TPR) repeat protein|nr:tetratricopeptide repeat protein [Woeseiaceae bacterium]
MAPAVAAAADDSDEIVIRDPQFGEVLFYFYQEDYFAAIARLLAAQKQEQLTEHVEDAELLLGGMYLSYGHHLEAADIFERLLADRSSPETRNRTWFFLAKIWYQRGYLDRAVEALGLIQGELPDDLRREALMLDAQILIDRGEYDAAIAKLQNWRGRTEWASYAKFNIGVALVRSGRVDEAATLLDELGQMNPFNEELTSLRDKANLALGYAYLQDGQPYAAKAPLQRVRLEGPFSNKALLGMGWADAELNNYHRALVPWMELRGRDLLDPAVQESMLAIPYAMAKLDSISQAADHYLNAIEAFYEESNRLDRTISRIETGEFFEEFIADDPLSSTGWYWDLEELPAGAEGRYLYHLMATHEFQEGLKNYRDLTYLYRNLDTWQQSVDVYANMVETRRQKFEQSLEYVEDALAVVDPGELIGLKVGYDAVIDNIEGGRDWLSLAEKSEFDMWREITDLELTPALQADIPEAAEVRDKINLLKGVMQWNLEREFRGRVATVRQDLQETGEALVATQRSWRQIQDTMYSEPLRLAELSDQVYGLTPHIEEMKARVSITLGRQRAFLQEIAVGELQVQKDRLDVYTIQARFALAAIYDIASTVGESGE